MFTITSGLLVLLSTFSGGIDQTANTIAVSYARPAARVIVADNGIVAADNPLTIESHVREYFKDEPVLAEIAGCESTFRHFDKNGKVIRGTVDKRDIGMMQINEYFHGERALKLGFDIHTLEGNLAYAKWLYEKEGTKPWKPSQKCWSKVEIASNAK